MECELKVLAKLVVNEMKGCLVKLVKNELMDCLKILLGIPGKIEEELVRNGRGLKDSRVAGWGVASCKTTVLMDVITSFASEASLVSLVRKWNVMVPRMEMAMIL